MDDAERARLRRVADSDLQLRRFAESELSVERNRGVKYPLIQRKLPNEKDRNYFINYASNNTSQCGEDGILEHLFALLGLPADGGRGYCVDIGAWDGKHLSNTYSLVHEQGWGGLLVEADPTRAEELRARYAGRDDVVCATTHITVGGGHSSPTSLPALLAAHGAPLEFDFLSIDIDGADYHVWADLAPTLYRPKVLCIEFNPTCSNTTVFVQAADARTHQGSSLLALVELGQSMGYTLVATTTYNGIFVRDVLLPFLPQFDRSLDALHVPHMGTEIFQTYDGEIVFTGVTKLLWHRLSMNPQKLQVLKKADRVFPFAPSVAVGNGDAGAGKHAGKGAGGGWVLQSAVAALEQALDAYRQAPGPSQRPAAEAQHIIIADLTTALADACADALRQPALEGLALAAVTDATAAADRALLLPPLPSHSPSPSPWSVSEPDRHAWAVAAAVHATLARTLTARGDALVGGAGDAATEMYTHAWHACTPWLHVPARPTPATPATPATTSKAATEAAAAAAAVAAVPSTPTRSLMSHWPFVSPPVSPAAAGTLPIPAASPRPAASPAAAMQTPTKAPVAAAQAAQAAPAAAAARELTPNAQTDIWWSEPWHAARAAAAEATIKLQRLTRRREPAQAGFWALVASSLLGPEEVAAATTAKAKAKATAPDDGQHGGGSTGAQPPANDVAVPASPSKHTSSNGNAFGVPDDKHRRTDSLNIIA